MSSAIFPGWSVHVVGGLFVAFLCLVIVRAAFWDGEE